MPGRRPLLASLALVSAGLPARSGLAVAPPSLAEVPPRERPCAPDASANIRQNVEIPLAKSTRLGAGR